MTKNNYIAYTRKWATTPKGRTFTTANTSGCGACCSRPTKTTSWECISEYCPLRNNIPTRMLHKNTAENHIRSSRPKLLTMLKHTRVTSSSLSTECVGRSSAQRYSRRECQWFHDLSSLGTNNPNLNPRRATPDVRVTMFFRHQDSS